MQSHAAVAQMVRATHRLAEQRPQVLVDVGVAGRAAEAAHAVQVLEQLAEGQRVGAQWVNTVHQATEVKGGKA